MTKIVTKYSSEDKVMLYDSLTNRFYRGAKLWRWTRSWRQASVLTIPYWNGHFEFDPLKSLLQSRPDDLFFVTLNDIPKEKLESWW